MKVEIPVDAHYAVGPHEAYGHEMATIFTAPDEDGITFVACLDCGYVVDDIRLLAHEDCRRDSNPINTTWSEALDG